MRFGRASAAATFVSLGVVLSLAGVVWACTPSPGVLTVGPRIASVGAQVDVKGTAMKPTAPVELRWNGSNGPVLGVVTTDSGGSFATSISVPRSTPGTYFVVAKAPTGLVRAPLDVMEQGRRPASALAAPTESSSRGGAFPAALPVAVAGMLVMGAVVAMSGRRLARAGAADR